MILAFSIGSTLHAAPKTLIFYPKSSNQTIIYKDLIVSLENAVAEETLAIPVNPNENNPTAYIQQFQPTRIIALELSMAKALKQSAYKLTSFAAGLYFTEHEFNGVSLSIDSRVLEKALQTIAPHLKRVFIVTAGYNVVDVNAVAKLVYTIRQGHPDDLAINSRLLVHLIEQEALPTDLIIVPPNIPDDIFYEIGKIAWEKKVMLASTRLSHLSSGALLSIQPNYPALGKQINGFDVRLGYQSLHHITLTWNKKVAEHLGVTLDDALMPLNVDLK